MHNSGTKCLKNWLTDTAKNEQVVTSLLTSCKNLLQADIRIRMACDSLLTTSLLQVVKRLVASCQQTCCKLIVITCHQQTCCKLTTGLLQVVSTTCNKSANDKLQQAFNRLFAVWWHWQVCCNLLTRLCHNTGITYVENWLHWLHRRLVFL